MSTSFIVYDAASGRIKRTGVAMGADGGGSLASAQAGSGEAVITGVTADPRTEYVDTSTGQIVPRPVMGLSIDKTSIAADSVDKATITGIPAGALYIIPSRRLSGVVNDGFLEITSAVAGAFDVVIELFPYQTWSVTVVAT